MLLIEEHEGHEVDQGATDLDGAALHFSLQPAYGGIIARHAEFGHEVFHTVANALHFERGIVERRCAGDLQLPHISRTRISHVAHDAVDPQISAQTTAHLLERVHADEAQKIHECQVALEVGLHSGFGGAGGDPIATDLAVAAVRTQVVHLQLANDALW